jgi:hypothetical protein
MRRVRVRYPSGDFDEYKCRTVSYGHDSRNILLYDAVDPATQRVISERVLLPLAAVVAVEESEW